jgi:hypothetical protein
MLKDKVSAQFPHTLKFMSSTLFLRAAPTKAVRVALETLIKSRLRAGFKRVSAPLQGQEDLIFAKTQPLPSLRSRMRATFGCVKRDGLYDWPVEEVLNTLEAHHRGANVAPMAGFGYSKSKVGLTQEYFILTKMLDEHIDGMNWVENSPEQVETFIQLSFRLLHSLNAKGLTHMDFWASNVMVNLRPEDAPCAIDLENCFQRATPYTSETLAFQFGFFYRRGIYRFITEARYDELVQQELLAYGALDGAKFAAIYQLSKHEVISRKARRQIFMSGTVKL